MHGTALDAQSGMSGGAAKVEWALTAGGARTAAVPSTGGDFSSWTANVPLSGFGAHTLFVWATDNAGNTTSKDIQVDVISSYVPASIPRASSRRDSARKRTAPGFTRIEGMVRTPGACSVRSGSPDPADFAPQPLPLSRTAVAGALPSRGHALRCVRNPQ